MMKIRIAILVITVASLLLGGVVLQAIVPVSAQPGRPDPTTEYTVEQGTASGEGFHLTGLRWQASGTASGAGFRLLGPSSPTLQGPGCCCTYLPLAVRGL